MFGCSKNVEAVVITPMHEISLVQHIFATLEEAFPDRMNRLTCIRIKAGLLSNVQPALMQSAFDAVVATEPAYAGIKLEVEVTPILIYCDDCKKTTKVINYRFICECGKPSKKIVQGEELLISQVEFSDEI
jgi:hydrogenase nickel incorporation protein HypA/HybF